MFLYPLKFINKRPTRNENVPLDYYLVGVVNTVLQPSSHSAFLNDYIFILFDNNIIKAYLRLYFLISLYKIGSEGYEKLLW